VRKRRNRRCNNIIWHYTVGWKLASIFNTRKIFQTIAGVEPPEKPVAWFSKNRIWEPTASKILGYGFGLPKEFLMRANHEECGGLVRIGIQERHAPYGIQDLQRVAHADRRTVDDLIRSGIRMGANPEHWRFTRKAVSANVWDTIQIWDKKSGWLPIDREMYEPHLIGTQNLIAR
jgi:hypothetical protein